MRAFLKTAAHVLIVLALVAVAKPLFLEIGQRIWPEKRVQIALNGPTILAQSLSVDASINGESVRFLVDTGATVVRLSRSTAVQIGIDVDGLKYDLTSHSVSGAFRTALVTVPSIKIGGIEVKNVQALVSERDSGPINLLGMTFLKQVSFDFDGRVLTLKQ